MPENRNAFTFIKLPLNVEKIRTKSADMNDIITTTNFFPFASIKKIFILKLRWTHHAKTHTIITSNAFMN